MRKGEILKLKGEDIDFSEKMIHIIETKTGQKREVPMNQLLYDNLTNLKQAKNGTYVFSNTEGKPCVDIRKSFKTALRRAGIKNFRFHDLRHTFASHLVMKGMDLRTVQDLMGHKSFEMTLRYTHLSPDHKRKAVDGLGQKCKNGHKLVTIAKIEKIGDCSEYVLLRLCACSSVDRTSASGAKNKESEKKDKKPKKDN